MQKLDERVMQAAPHEEEMELRNVAAALGRRKWSILFFALLVAVIAGLIAYAMAPVYRASTTLLIEAEAPNVVSITDVYGGDARTQQYFETQFEILKSRPLAEKVVDRLDLASKPEFTMQPPAWRGWLDVWMEKWGRAEKVAEPTKTLPEAGLPETEIVNRYSRRLSIAPTPKTQLVSVSFEARDPALAAEVANSHAQAYIENYLEQRESMTRSASQWLTGRAEELRGHLSESEKKLQAFKESEHLLDVDTGIQALPARELNELSTKLIESQRLLSENRNVFEQVQMARYSSLDQKLAIPAVGADPLVKQFRQARATAELKVAEIENRYGQQHPAMQSALAERKEAERSLAQQVESVMASIENQQNVLEGQTRAVASALNRTKATVQSVSRKESQYRALMQEVETNRELYTLFYKRISETNQASNLSTTNARVISSAGVPLHPVKPNRPLIIGMAFFAALIIGVVVVLLGDLMHSTIRSSSDVERRIGLPLLGLVPRIRRRGRRRPVGREYVENSDPKFGEAIRTLRTAISLSNLESGHKIVMVSSSCGDEGKTSIACNLALAFAQIERVLLIDADMRRASVAEEFELDPDHPGLAELCAGTKTTADCIIRLEREQIDVLTAGSIPANPQELLSSRRLQEMLNKLRGQYDRIVIDTSPVLPVSDALLLANRADALVYVVKADSTTVDQVRSGLQLFRRTPVDVKGVILNQVNLKKIAEYGSAYSYGSYELRGSN